jgi:hypothetical protein
MTADVSFTLEAVDKASSAITGIRGSILTLNQAMQLAQTAYQAINNIINETVGLYIKQADAVRTLNQINGQSAQTNSRLIETLDDYKITTEEIITAQRKMATQDESLTIPTLAALSDAYLKLNTGAERQQFLTDNFGRASAGWAEVMTQGSVAIKARSDAISDGLILDQAAIDKAREYQYQQDDLKDTFKALKMEIGQGMIPTLIELNTEVMNGIAGWEKFFDIISYNKSVTDLAWQLQKADGQIQGVGRSTRTLQQKYIDMALAQMAATKAMEDHYAAETNSYQATKDLTTVTADNTEVTLSWGEAEAWAAEQAKLAAAASEELRKQIIDKTTWEQSYMGAKTWADVTKLQIDWISQQLQNLSADGALVWEGYLEATGKISPAALAEFVRIQEAYQTMKKMLEMGVSVKIIVQWLVEKMGGAPAPQINEGRPGYHYDPESGMWVPDTSRGGAFQGWAMVGDSPGGGKTPYTEWVYAPEGATVFNQAQMAGKSAPPMASGGTIAPSSEMDLSDASIRKLADALFMSLLAQGQ